MQRRPSLTATRLVALADLIREHCHTDGSEATYDEGWDDKRIAAESDASYWTVRSLRASLLGQIKRPISDAPEPDAWHTEVERRLLALEARGGNGAVAAH